MLKVFMDFFWIVAIIFLIGGGLYFTYKLKFPQLNFLNLIKSLNNKGEGISPFKCLSISLAAKIGVGSISGIALAIYYGGPGTIFWIWIVGIITSINAYCETYLGCKYQIKNDNNYEGGPSIYIFKGLKNKKLSFTYGVIVIFAYIFGFMSIQANTISVLSTNLLGINKIAVVITITIICFISIINGIKGITNITGRIVPIMGICYIMLSIIIIIKNISLIPQTLWIIINDAFNKKSFLTGFVESFFLGVQRGVFSTEAGLGTSAIATSCTKAKDRKSYSLMQIIGIYFTIFIICTSTALIILTSKYNNIIFSNINGIELTQYALNYHLGKFGNIILLITVIMLAYSTIIAGYYYGENNLRYLIKKDKYSKYLKIISIVVLFLGGLTNPKVIWILVDFSVSILAIINMYSLFMLRKEIIDDFYNVK